MDTAVDTAPPIDATALLDWLAGQPLDQRLAAADAAVDAARALVGKVAEARRAVLVVLIAADADVDLSSETQRKALAPDRALLREALILMLGQDVSTARVDFLSQGLKERARIDVMARRVLGGAKALSPSALRPEEVKLIRSAERRAVEILEAVISQDS
jgi:hypothetical protein